MLVLRVEGINGSPRQSVLALSARVPDFAKSSEVDNKVWKVTGTGPRAFVRASQ